MSVLACACAPPAGLRFDQDEQVAGVGVPARDDRSADTEEVAAGEAIFGGPPEIQKRLVAFWNWRLADARETAPGRELAAFGWWLASKKLDSQWAIAQLLEILKAGSKIDPDFLVLEYLADVAPQLPLAVTECLILLVEGAYEPWQVYAWREHLERALVAVLSGDDKAARRRAKDLVNMLAARGHLGSG